MIIGVTHCHPLAYKFAHEYKYLGFWLKEFLDMEESRFWTAPTGPLIY